MACFDFPQRSLKTGKKKKSTCEKDKIESKKRAAVTHKIYLEYSNHSYNLISFHNR